MLNILNPPRNNTANCSARKFLSLLRALRQSQQRSKKKSTHTRSRIRRVEGCENFLQIKVDTYDDFANSL
jgi:hypothetical protein